MIPKYIMKECSTLEYKLIHRGYYKKALFVRQLRGCYHFDSRYSEEGDGVEKSITIAAERMQNDLPFKVKRETIVDHLTDATRLQDPYWEEMERLLDTDFDYENEMKQADKEYQLWVDRTTVKDLMKILDKQKVEYPKGEWWPKKTNIYGRYRVYQEDTWLYHFDDITWPYGDKVEVDDADPESFCYWAKINLRQIYEKLPA